MTFKILKEIMERHHIPDDVVLMSDSGWDGDASHMDGVFYCEEENIMIFTQDAEYPERYVKANDKWKCLWPFGAQKVNEEE